MIEVYRNFFDDEYCEFVYEFGKKNFIYELRYSSDWKTMKNTSVEFETEIKSKISHLVDFNNARINKIFLTEYKENESLVSHLDNGSNDNFIIQLTSKFTGGEFMVEDEIITTEKGDCIRFDGGKLRHGITPIKSGIRVALNIWTTPKGKKLI